jgi:hypothetical protein
MRGFTAMNARRAAEAARQGAPVPTSRPWRARLGPVVWPRDAEPPAGWGGMPLDLMDGEHEVMVWMWDGCTVRLWQWNRLPERLRAQVPPQFRPRQLR